MRSSLWRAGNDCDAPERVTRDVTVRFPYAGTWTVLAGDASVVLSVLAEPAGACGSAPVTACERDCDCPGDERCLSGFGSNGSIQRCARPCEFDRECQGLACGDDDGLPSVCLQEVAECELPARPCEQGFDCEAGSCVPSFHLNQSTRHDCRCDSECDPGLRCVERWTSGEPAHRCEAVCATLNDGWCEGPHSCNPAASVEDSQGVCGWVGE
jgi:hypothetical protein